MIGLSLPPLNIPALLRQFGLRPSKGLGQNFLQDNRALQEIIARSEIGPADDILEIGPGLGSLTRYLALAAHHVTAVELDKGLFPALETVIAPYKNVHLVQGDILKLEPATLMFPPGLAGAAVRRLPAVIVGQAVGWSRYQGEYVPSAELVAP